MRGEGCVLSEVISARTHSSQRILISCVNTFSPFFILFFRQGIEDGGIGGVRQNRLTK